MAKNQTRVCFDSKQFNKTGLTLRNKTISRFNDYVYLFLISGGLESCSKLKYLDLSYNQIISTKVNKNNNLK